MRHDLHLHRGFGPARKTSTHSHSAPFLTRALELPCESGGGEYPIWRTRLGIKSEAHGFIRGGGGVRPVGHKREENTQFFNSEASGEKLYG